MEEIEIVKRFVAASDNAEIVQARNNVISSAAAALKSTAELTHVGGFIRNDKQALALALVAYIGSELANGIRILVKDELLYASAALLRQLIEVEYLAFLGYAEPARLARWYSSPPDDIRREFTPGKMRKASNGLFADHEYWTHCENGGHPHPHGRKLLDAYPQSMNISAYLLPDICQHMRRLWTSVRLGSEEQNRADCIAHVAGDEHAAAIRKWEITEDPFILSFNGIRDG